LSSTRAWLGIAFVLGVALVSSVRDVSAQSALPPPSINAWVAHRSSAGQVEVGRLPIGTTVSIELSVAGTAVERRTATVQVTGFAAVNGQDLNTPLVPGTQITVRDGSGSVLAEHVIQPLSASWSAETGVLTGSAEPGTQVQTGYWPINGSVLVADSQGTWRTNLDPTEVVNYATTIEAAIQSGWHSTRIAFLNAAPPAEIAGLSRTERSLWLAPQAVPMASVFRAMLDAQADECRLATIVGGAWILFIPGAPRAVNESWIKTYPGLLPLGQVFMSICP